LVSSPLTGVDAPDEPSVAARAPDLTQTEIKRLLKACEGSEFFDRRDASIIRVFLDTGMRRAELASLTVGDVDLKSRLARVTAQGHTRHERQCPLATKTVSCLRSYLKARSEHRFADLPNLWIGKAGPLTEHGVHSILAARGNQAGIKHLSARRLRRAFVQQWLASGGSETDLMALTGWQLRQTVARYTDSRADRAQQAHRRLSLGERW
jgi:integrase